MHCILPHDHDLGNDFDVTVVGGEHGGESIYRLDGFNADANGKTDVHRARLDHEVIAGAGMPLITPGDPNRTWLYRLVSRCEPDTADGGSAAQMPLNAPILLEDPLVAKLRAWIERGAAND